MSAFTPNRFTPLLTLLATIIATVLAMSVAAGVAAAIHHVALALRAIP